jgi:site-specific DNA-methyltransferase (adenine-specific)
LKELLGSLELNRIYQMDCLEGMKLIPDKSIDMVLCDLPYGTTSCKWDNIIPFEPLWKQYERIIKDNGAIVLTASQPFTTKLINSNIDLFKYCWYWEKDKGTGFAFSGKQPLRKIEEICVFYKKQPTYDSQGEKLDQPYKHTLPIKKSDSGGISSDNLNSDGSRKYVWYTHKKKHNLIYFARDNANKGIHPTQKPVSLFEYLIKTYTNENEIVLDNCIGSGTTAVAATLNNRKWIGFETDNTYFELANKRLEQIELHNDLNELS